MRGASSASHPSHPPAHRESGPVATLWLPQCSRTPGRAIAEKGLAPNERALASLSWGPCSSRSLAQGRPDSTHLLWIILRGNGTMPGRNQQAQEQSRNPRKAVRTNLTTRRHAKGDQRSASIMQTLCRVPPACPKRGRWLPQGRLLHLPAVARCGSGPSRSCR
jgi:hypothetical protein